MPPRITRGETAEGRKETEAASDGTRLQRDPFTCAHCGYDLRGLPGPICPECGRRAEGATGPADE